MPKYCLYYELHRSLDIISIIKTFIMVKTEKQKEILNALKDMEEIMRVKGYLPIQHAHEFLMKGMSISENYEQLYESREKWKARALSNNLNKQEVKKSKQH